MPKQHLSALMDDHFDAPEAIRPGGFSDEEQAYWERMHLTRDVLRGEYRPLLDAGFAERVMDALDEAPQASADDKVVSLQSRRHSTAHWRQMAGGLAVAATVAAVSVFGWRSLSAPQPGALPSVAQNNGLLPQPAVAGLPAAAQPRVQLVNNSGTYWVVGNRRIADAGTEERLNSLLSDHMESGARSVGGSLPYGRLVGYDEAAR
ncbi:RseA family anti-sigma factor [Granulosicoccaceae sp. 1_MG-2023]|nr:RseA family anti-sigma factor [Granulosicoccaceae sp. 1_MG-2023]